MDNRLTPFRIALLYAAFAGLWIFASDKLLALAVPDPRLLMQISMFKGFAFVIVTTLLLFLLVRALVTQTSEKDKQLKLFYDLPFIGMAISSPESKAWLYVNDHLCEMLGYSREELLHTTWADITYPDDLSGNVEQFDRMQAGKIDGYSLEKRFIRKDGSLLTVNLDVKCTRGVDGKAHHIVAMIEDITERKRTEQALCESEATYRSLFENMLNGVAHYRMIFRNGVPVDYEFIAVNPAFAQTTGLKDVIGKKVSEVIPGYCENNKDSLQVFGKVAQTGESARWEHYLAALGKWFSFSIYSPAQGEFVVVNDDITERQLAEKALRESEDRFRSIFANAIDGILIADAGTRKFIMANQAIERMLGYNQQEILNIGVDDIHPAEELPAIVEGFYRQFAGEVALAPDLPVKRKDGSVFYADVNAAPVTLDGKAYLMGVFRDITERKRTEQALRESEDRFRSLFANAMDGIALIDTQTRKCIMANTAFEQMLGYEHDEINSIGVDDLHPAELLPDIINEFSKRLTGANEPSQDQPVQRKNGSLFYANITAGPVTIGGKTFMLATFRDITERKNSEDALRQSATVFESSHDGVTITDLNGNILAVNSSFLKITGYSEAEVLGRNPSMLHSGRQSRDFYQSMWASIKEIGYWHGEIWNRRKNGEIYPEWLTISAVKNTEGQTTHYVGTFSDISQLKQSETQLEHLAHYDPLTGLPNRLLVLSHLSHALSQAQRHHHHVGVLYIDLDRFKNVNDSLGYPVGDELLVTLAERLTMHMRSEDMLARMGGDEFLLVLDRIEEPEDAAMVSRAVLELLTQPFVLSGEQEIFVGASIGISVFPNDGGNADQLIQYADSAMHQAKQQGRNTYLYYTEALTRASGAHLEMETRLRHAITASQLRVYYQPQVDIASGRIIGAEALVRWQDPQRGLISPANFIPLAEESGLIGIIGEWVLKEACLQGVRWIDAGLPFLTLAVNLSPHQFQRGNIVDVVSRVLAETGFPADRLELELTESALMQQEEKAVKMLHLLRAQNIRLAIDDFGTGYSSLSYLKRFPLDILKIDKSFVDDIPFHQDDMEIAATIITMGHSLGFRVMAEGVETPEQLNFLQAKGCDMYQGYLTSPPVPAEDFVKLLLKKSRPA